MMEQVKPLVSYPTASSSESVLTVLQMYNNGTYDIPDYQRDSDQWSKERKSLFIESVINNLTVPAFFIAPTEGGKYEVVDGQQRLTTLKEYHANDLRLVESDEADYLGDRSAYYAGRRFQDVKQNYPLYAQAFEGFLLTLIKLPQGIGDSTRREIFRRINDAGTPLSAQDIRLAYFGSCKVVTLIRLCGIYEPEREGSKRMITSALSKYDLHCPWAKVNQTAREGWKEWWSNTNTAFGQTASEMFLWFLIAKYFKPFDDLLSNTDHLASALKTGFDGRTQEAADVFCAQLLYESKNESSPRILCSSEEIQEDLFPEFAEWWHHLIIKMPSIGCDRNRRITLLIAALSSSPIKDPGNLTEEQMELVETVIRSPRQAYTQLGVDVPVAKGKWRGNRGQRAQIEALNELAKAISSK